MAKGDCVRCIHSVVCKYRSRNEQPWIEEHCKLAARDERPRGECRTCKHFVKGGLDGKTYVCEHPNIEQEDYYNYACLMVEENDFCSSYEARKKEGESDK